MQLGAKKVLHNSPATGLFPFPPEVSLEVPQYDAVLPIACGLGLQLRLAPGHVRRSNLLLMACGNVVVLIIYAMVDQLLGLLFLFLSVHVGSSSDKENAFLVDINTSGWLGRPGLFGAYRTPSAKRINMYQDHGGYLVKTSLLSARLYFVIPG